MGIQDRAVLVLLNVRTWTARRYDDDASATVAEHHHSKKDMGRYNKCLIDVKDKAFTRPIKIVNQMRTLHYRYTSPWIHKGADLLTTAMFLRYKSDMGKLAGDLEDAVQDLIRAYPKLKARAKRDLNGLYKEEDYPLGEELAQKFGCQMNFMPIPHSDDLRVSLSAKETAKIKAQITAQVERATKEAMQDLWVRLHDVASKMAVALKDPERRFHDTLVGNVQDLVEILPDLAVADDPDLAKMTEEVRKQLTKHSTEVLREDLDVRKDTAKKADALAKKMKSLMPVLS